MRLIDRFTPLHGLFLAASLFGIALASGPPLAQAEAGTTRAEATRVQRPLSEDPLIDQNLVATLPDTDQRIAAMGSAARAIVPRFNAMWPTSGEITTYFGEVGPFSPHGHSGLDIAAAEDTPIVAADEGEVLKAYWNAEGYGGLVIIGHPSGYETWYGHLDSFDVAKGEHVTRGQAIGSMGSTGYSTGPHLHFEVRQDGQVCDPLDFLKEVNLQPAD